MKEVIFEQRPEVSKDETLKRSQGRAFQVERIASIKVLRQEHDEEQQGGQCGLKGVQEGESGRR